MTRWPGGTRADYDNMTRDKQTIADLNKMMSNVKTTPYEKSIILSKISTAESQLKNDTAKVYG